MSIQPGRVLWRIVDEVARAPRAQLARRAIESSVFRDAAQGERMEVARSPARLSNGEPPFATLLHFWTHALREWLEELGQGDQLVGAAGYAMCENVDAAAMHRVLDAFGRRLESGSSALQVRGEFAEAYRMIEGGCRASFVVATDTEWLSITWGHGLERARVLPTHRTATTGWQLHRTA